MNNTTAVDVFLGHPLVDLTEKQFLARLRRDLAARGLRARVLANLQLGGSFRQLDFVIVTDQRVVVIELKGWNVPVVGRANGRWQRVVDGRRLPTEGNPYRQAHDGGYALSDAMRAFRQEVGAPAPRRDKFVKDLELVVCLYPAVHEQSSLEHHPWVRAVGYDELLADLPRSGRRPAWADADWDGFIRHHGLYRDGEDAAAAQALRASTAAVDEYCARYVAATRAICPSSCPPG